MCRLLIKTPSGSKADSQDKLFAVNCHMAHLTGTDRLQLLLLPEAVDDYVGPDNAVRFIEALVDQLDLQAAGFVRVTAKVSVKGPMFRCDIHNRTQRSST